MKNYVKASLETHLFFARIMKEHALFLQAGFVSKDMEWIRRADFFRRQFEDLLARTVDMSNHMVGKHVLTSGEVVTPYTMDAERATSRLSGIPTNMRITAVQRNLECAHKDYEVSRSDVQMVHGLNERAVRLLNGLIEFKERILQEVKKCSLYTGNYPLLIEHITREARLYRDMVESMMQEKNGCEKKRMDLEEFWNCIMMEHAMFIRGLLDPSEAELMVTANDFVNDFSDLLDEACKKECKANACSDKCDLKNGQKDTCAQKETYANRVMKKTCELRDFKATATEGLLNCQIKSLILPLLADHVLREANHFIRIQEQGYK